NQEVRQNGLRMGRLWLRLRLWRLRRRLWLRLWWFRVDRSIVYPINHRRSSVVLKCSLLKRHMENGYRAGRDHFSSSPRNEKTRKVFTLFWFLNLTFLLAAV